MLVLSGVSSLSAAVGSPVEFASTPADLAAFAKFLLQHKQGSASAVGQVRRVAQGLCPLCHVPGYLPRHTSLNVGADSDVAMAHPPTPPPHPPHTLPPTITTTTTAPRPTPLPPCRSLLA